jgi:hypothetical protein
VVEVGTSPASSHESTSISKSPGPLPLHARVRVAGYDLPFYAMVWYGTVRYGMVRYGMVWYGMVWYGNGMVWYGMVWYAGTLLVLQARHLRRVTCQMWPPAQ